MENKFIHLGYLISTNRVSRENLKNSFKSLYKTKTEMKSFEEESTYLKCILLRLY